MAALTSFSIFAVDMSSPPDSLVVTPTGEVGVGTASPAAPLAVERSDGTAKILIEENSGVRQSRRLLELKNNGAPALLFNNAGTSDLWELNPNASNNFTINKIGTGGIEVLIDKGNGNMTVKGDVIAKGVTLTSSRETKEEFAPVDAMEILETVSGLAVTKWQFKDDEEKMRHIGPMAEDFEAAFNLGTDGKTISVTDVNGIALASIQALNHKLATKDAELSELRLQNAAQNERLEKLERLLLVK